MAKKLVRKITKKPLKKVRAIGSRSNKEFLSLVAIRAGSFRMGSPKSEPGRSPDENQVRVRITKSFRMGRTVVTQGQWRAVMGTEPWRDYVPNNSANCDDELPATCVDWDDASKFCRMLTRVERKAGRLAASQEYRLPTEAEWEYACRAGTTTAYSFGRSAKTLGAHAWYGRNSGFRLHKVARRKSNPWGLFDMHGNVWEWCFDWYADKLVGGNDPVGPSIGDARVCRGGSSWDEDEADCRSATRFPLEPDYVIDSSGFRVVCVG